MCDVKTSLMEQNMKVDKDVIALLRATKKAAKPIAESVAQRKSRSVENEHPQPAERPPQNS
jgi:hypothetical protein